MNQRLNRWILYLIPLTFMLISPWLISEAAMWTGYGQHLWHDWNFLYHDSVSILPTDNNTTSAWFPALIYYGFYQLGGLDLVAHFHHVILLCLLALIYRQTIFRNPWPWTWQERFSIYAMWLGAGAFFSARPALLAYIPFLLSFIILEKVQARKSFEKKDWLYLTLLQILWVNLHGSFVLLPVMLAWVALFRLSQLKRNFLGGCVVLLGSLINPFTWQIYSYVLRTREYSKVLNISEWASAFSFTYSFQTIIFWILFLVSIALIWKSSKRREILSSPFIPLLIIPVTGIRLSVFAFCALPIFLSYHSHVFKKREAPERNKIWAGPVLAFVVILALAIVGSPYLKPSFKNLFPPKIQANYDEASLFAIAREIRGSNNHDCPVFNDINVGNFLFLEIPNPLLIDGRVTPFTRTALDTYLALMKLENLEEMVEAKKPCFAIFSENRSGELIETLRTRFGFKNAITENGYLLLTR